MFGFLSTLLLAEIFRDQGQAASLALGLALGFCRGGRRNFRLSQFMLFMTYGLDKIHRWSLSFPGKSARSRPNRIGNIPGPGVTNITAPSRMSPNASRFLRMRNGMRTDAGFLSSQLFRLTLVNASAGISTRIQGITITPIDRAKPEIHRTASLEIHCSIIKGILSCDATTGNYPIGWLHRSEGAGKDYAA